MKNNITEEKLSDFNINKTKISNSYNSYSYIKNINYPSINNNGIPKKIFFNINGQDFNFNNERDINSYLYINSERQKINLNNLKLKTESKSECERKRVNKSQYYLPVLMEKKIDKSKLSLYLKDTKPINKKGLLKQGNLNQSKNKINNKSNNINKNAISLHLNTISINKNKNSKDFILKLGKHNSRNLNLSSKEKNNKKLDDYLEKIKNYRKRLKEQMINRYKVQYSPNSISISTKLKNNKNENDNNPFVYNYDNKSINNISKNVNNALNIFYGKIPNSKISGYEKSYLKYSNTSTEKYILNDEIKKNINTINID